MPIDFLTQKFKRHLNEDAVIWKNDKYSYDWLSEKVGYFETLIESSKLKSGAVVAIQADFSPHAIALFFALAKMSCIIVPLHNGTPNKKELEKIANVEFAYRVNERDEILSESISADNELNVHYRYLREIGHPGLVLFTSGSSGKPKGAVHDFTKLLDKFKTQRPAMKILNFLLFDHWGGLNTMLHTLSNGGVVFTVENRAPESICQLIEKHEIEILPTSPTFLNVLLLSGAIERYDLSSLKVISYGTEPMPASTLKTLYALFPDIKLQQTYGLVEVGVLRSKSKSSNSLWVKVGGDGYETRVKDGLLEIKAESKMLGYLNAPNPFTVDGWYMTGDKVEINGDYIKLLGRQSEIINVGGEKVSPIEVESVIQEIDNVSQVTVYGEENMIMGNIVCAKVVLCNDENHAKFKLRLQKYCRRKMSPFKVPIKVKITSEQQYGSRYKKLRAS